MNSLKNDPFETVFTIEVCLFLKIIFGLILALGLFTVVDAQNFIYALSKENEILAFLPAARFERQKFEEYVVYSVLIKIYKIKRILSPIKKTPSETIYNN